MGEGATEKAAKVSAVAEISLFFETKTEVLTQAVQRSCEIVAEDQKMFASSKSFGQIVNIKSNADFFGVNFTDLVYDSKNDITGLRATPTVNCSPNWRAYAASMSMSRAPNVACVSAPFASAYRIVP